MTRLGPPTRRRLSSCPGASKPVLDETKGGSPTLRLRRTQRRSAWRGRRRQEVAHHAHLALAGAPVRYLCAGRLDARAVLPNMKRDSFDMTVLGRVWQFGALFFGVSLSLTWFDRYETPQDAVDQWPPRERLQPAIGQPPDTNASKYTFIIMCRNTVYARTRTPCASCMRVAPLPSEAAGGMPAVASGSAATAAEGGAPSAQAASSEAPAQLSAPAPGVPPPSPPGVGATTMRKSLRAAAEAGQMASKALQESTVGSAVGSHELFIRCVALPRARAPPYGAAGAERTCRGRVPTHPAHGCPLRARERASAPPRRSTCRGALLASFLGEHVRLGGPPLPAAARCGEPRCIPAAPHR